MAADDSGEVVAIEGGINHRARQGVELADAAMHGHVTVSVPVSNPFHSGRVDEENLGLREPYLDFFACIASHIADDFVLRSWVARVDAGWRRSRDDARRRYGKRTTVEGEARAWRRIPCRSGLAGAASCQEQRDRAHRNAKTTWQHRQSSLSIAPIQSGDGHRGSHRRGPHDRQQTSAFHEPTRDPAARHSN